MDGEPRTPGFPLAQERRLIQQTKRQLHERDQRIVEILTERGRARRGAAS